MARQRGFKVHNDLAMLYYTTGYISQILDKNNWKNYKVLGHMSAICSDIYPK